MQDMADRQLTYFKLKHTKQRDEVRKRTEGVEDQDQRKALLSEVTDHNKALRYLEILASLNDKAINSKREFDRCIYSGMKRINEGSPGDTLNYLKQANQNLLKLRSICRSQKEIEKELIDLTKRTIKDLNYEKDALKR
jgi:hypothetical protein